MAGRDGDSGDEPSLELPSFGLRGRKRRAAPESREEAPTTETAPVTREMPRAQAPRPEAPRPEAPRPEADPPPRRRRELPRLAGPAAAAGTGAVVGLLAVGATFAALRGCEAVRGTASCGGGPGFLLLLAVLVLLTWVGSLALQALGVEDPGSTSLLAVGLLAVVALLFLVEVLTSPWMVLVLPLVGAATFTVSHQVTTAVVEDGD